MKKGVKILCCVLPLLLMFVLGWRVMPKIWPGIKEGIVYPVFPQMKPTPAPTQEPYMPKGDLAYGDPVYETDSVIYYFYKDYCPHCRALEYLTTGLPKQIFLADGTQSDVKLICLNKVENQFLHVSQRYYEENNIPEDQRYVPSMVIGDKYLLSESVIAEQLMDAVIAGEGLKTPLLDGNERISKTE